MVGVVVQEFLRFVRVAFRYGCVALMGKHTVVGHKEHHVAHVLAVLAQRLLAIHIELMASTLGTDYIKAVVYHIKAVAVYQQAVHIVECRAACGLRRAELLKHMAEKSLNALVVEVASDKIGLVVGINTSSARWCSGIDTVVIIIIVEPAQLSLAQQIEAVELVGIDFKQGAGIDAAANSFGIGKHTGRFDGGCHHGTQCGIVRDVVIVKCVTAVFSGQTSCDKTVYSHAVFYFKQKNRIPLLVWSVTVVGKIIDIGAVIFVSGFDICEAQIVLTVWLYV